MARISYTQDTTSFTLPDGRVIQVPRRESGYYNPANPMDTGRKGERNTEWLSYFSMGIAPGAKPGGSQDPFAGGWEGFDPSKAPPIPGASQVGQTYLTAVDAYKRALARFSQQRQGLMSQYGYTGDVDSKSGVFKNVRVDPNNPYGEYQLNRRSNYMDYLGAEENRTARGLGRKGLGSQMLNDLRFGWGGKDVSTSSSLINSLYGVDSEQQQGYADMVNSYWEALLSATRDGVEGGDFGYADDPAYADEGAEPDIGPEKGPTAGRGNKRAAGKDYGLGVYRDKQGRLTYKAPRKVPKYAGAWRSTANNRAPTTARAKAAQARAMAARKRAAAARKRKPAKPTTKRGR